jgi:hypothetical protein
VICSQCKGNLKEIKHGDCLSKERDGGNKDDLQNLQEDMKEFKDLLKTAICRSVKEVILHKINVILEKINILTEVCKRKMENNWWWTEVMRRSVNLFANENKHTQIPVINNRYAVLSNLKDPGSGAVRR